MLTGWDSTLATIVGTVSDSLSTLVIVVGFIVLRPAWIWLMLGVNRRRAFRTLGRGNPQLAWHVKRAKEIARGLPPSPQAELASWLPDLDEEESASPQLLELLRRRPSQSGDTFGASLARGYEDLARALNSRLLFGAGVPVVSDQATLARQTADYLTQLSPVYLLDLDTIELGHGVAGSLLLRRQSVGQLISFHAFPGQYAGHHAFELVSVLTPELLSAPYPGSPAGEGFARHRALDLEPHESAALEKHFRNEHIFDGLLPRLTRLSSARDKTSGHRLLVAELSATTYGAVIAEHYAGEAQARRLAPDPAKLRVRGVRTTEVDGTGCGLLTLSLAPLTRDGYVIFIQRSRSAGSHEGAIGPGVNGNLEMNPRRGLHSDDADTHGTPDPLRALAREGREELGLDLDPEDIDCLGLVTFSAPTEIGTHCLVTSCSLGVTLEDVVHGMHRASTLEGRWEVGPRMIGMRLPSGNERGSLEQHRARARWLLTDERLTPHAVAAGLSVLVAQGQGDIQLTDLLDQEEATPVSSHRPSFTRFRRRSVPPEWIRTVDL